MGTQDPTAEAGLQGQSRLSPLHAGADATAGLEAPIVECSAPSWEFPRIEFLFCGPLQKGFQMILVSILGPLIFGNSQLGCCFKSCKSFFAVDRFRFLYCPCTTGATRIRFAA